MAEKRIVRHYIKSFDMNNLLDSVNKFTAGKNVGNILDVQIYDRILSIDETKGLTDDLTGKMVKTYNYLHEAIIVELVEEVSKL